MRQKIFLLLVMLASPAYVMAQNAPKIVRQISSVQTVCTEDLLAKNHESNEVLFGLLDKFYGELEDQFRAQVQRSSSIGFAYSGYSSSRAAVKFAYYRMIRPEEAKAKCDASIRSGGGIQAVSPTTFRVTIYLGIRRNATPAERSLSEAEKGNTLTLWHYKLQSNTFTTDTLRYTAHLHALQLAASLISATKEAQPLRQVSTRTLGAVHKIDCAEALIRFNGVTEGAASRTQLQNLFGMPDAERDGNDGITTLQYVYSECSLEFSLKNGYVYQKNSIAPRQP